DLACLLDVGIVGDRQSQLLDDPVPAHILHGTKVAKGNRKNRPAIVPKPDGAQAEGFHGPLVAPAFYVFANAKSIIDEIKDAADNVLDQGLRPKADCNTGNSGARYERCHLDAKLR